MQHYYCMRQKAFASEQVAANQRDLTAMDPWISKSPAFGELPTPGLDSALYPKVSISKLVSATESMSASRVIVYPLKTLPQRIALGLCQ